MPKSVDQAPIQSSFILHIDSLDFMDEMTDEEIGRIFKAIRHHVRREKYTLPKLENLVFLPIRNSLDRESDKWNMVVEKRRIAGSIGGKQRVANQANASKRKQRQANQAVSVSVSDSVNVSENVSVSENESELESASALTTSERKPSPPYDLVKHVIAIQGIKPFPALPIQLAAAKRILQSEYSLEEAKAAADRMQADPYWKARAWDLNNLARNITKYHKLERDVDEGFIYLTDEGERVSGEEYVEYMRQKGQS